MKKEDREMIEKIMATEKVGYAYVYPMDGGARKEHYISMTSENIEIISEHIWWRKAWSCRTDIADNLELNTFGCFINTCTSRKLCMELQELLFPIQCGDEEPGEVLAVDRSVADKYFQQEDEAVTMAEMSMP
ncbi:MAG: hypothetical protein ACLU77_11940 [Waltera sp.]